jgi:hypothetical protein
MIFLTESNQLIFFNSMPKKNQENKTIENNKQSKFLSLLFFFKNKHVPVTLFILIIILIGAPALTYGVMTLRARIALSIQDRNNKLEQAIEANDYDTWYDVIGDKTLKEKITRENFSDYVLSYKMLKIGDVEGANAIKRTLGLKESFNQTPVVSQNLDSVINSGDYKTWRGMVGNSMPQIDQDNFSDYVKAYQAASSGDVSKASGFLRKLNLKSKDFSSSR